MCARAISITLSICEPMLCWWDACWPLWSRTTESVACCELLRRQWVSVLAPLALVLVVVVAPSSKAVALVLWSTQPLIVAVMLLQAAYWGNKSWTFMGHATVRLTAQLSYALYLYHPLAGRIVNLLGTRPLGYPAALHAHARLARSPQHRYLSSINCLDLTGWMRLDSYPARRTT
jgi:peptidoglycan/LPS O-acetylase OafA/YrhL